MLVTSWCESLLYLLFFCSGRFVMVLLNPPLSASSAMDISLIYSILINVDNICCNNHANIVFFTANVKQWSQSYGTCLWRHWWWWRHIWITWRADLLSHHQERYHLRREVRNGSKVINGLYLHVCTTVHNDEGIKHQIPVTVTLSDIWKNIPLPLHFCVLEFLHFNLWFKCLIGKMYLKRHIRS